MSRKCKYEAYAFCYICGQFIKARDIKYELNTSHVPCEAYESYFGYPVRNQGKTWAPHVACSYGKRCLEDENCDLHLSRRTTHAHSRRLGKMHVPSLYAAINNVMANMNKEH
ncbi:uncharacterized protein LOC128855808 [Anastrepha ludens]|uniref:uncharacterized protein LOC128855808 n=1 Tax=Anastrepha ludens TaxID=28586 RepID=UPI0023AEB5AD|nr:uncharacterized protein LOC128855808 [Anastrepha ludens]